MTSKAAYPGIITGIPLLDDDLRTTLDVVQSGELTEILENIHKSPDIDIDYISSNIPSGVLRLAAACKAGELEKLKSKVTEESWKLIETASCFLQDNIASLLSNPEVIGYIQEETLQEHKSIDMLSNSIDSIQWQSNWILEGNKFIPSVKILLQNEEQSQIVMLSTFRWTELMFLINGLIDVFRAEVGSLELFKNKDLISQKFLEEIANIISSLDQGQKSIQSALAVLSEFTN